MSGNIRVVTLDFRDVNSQHIHLFLRYGRCYTCATYGSSSRDTHRYIDMIKSSF